MGLQAEKPQRLLPGHFLRENKSNFTFSSPPGTPGRTPSPSAVHCRSWPGHTSRRPAGYRWTTGFRPAMRSWPRKGSRRFDYRHQPRIGRCVCPGHEDLADRDDLRRRVLRPDKSKSNITFSFAFDHALAFRRSQRWNPLSNCAKAGHHDVCKADLNCGPSGDRTKSSRSSCTERWPRPLGGPGRSERTHPGDVLPG